MEQRCAWVNDDPLYINYHDNEWGKPVYDDRILFEFLILEGMQAGLNWFTILKKRMSFRSHFDNFDAELIALYDDNKIAQLMSNKEIIRNRLKIEASIINAKAFLAINQRPGDFSNYVWSFVRSPIKNHWTDHKFVPVNTPISDAMSADLRKKGFKFVGSTICYAFMQATGMVNDHTANCFCY